MLARPFLFLWVNQALSRVAYNLVVFTNLIWVYQLTSSNAAVSLWIVAFLVASVSFALLAGVLADLFDRKVLIVVSNLLWGAGVLLFIPVRNSFPGILAVTLVTQALDEFFLPSQVSSLPKLAGNHRLLLANSLFSLTTYASVFLGFFLAGPLLRFVGYPAPFLLATGLILIGALFSLALPPLGHRERPPGPAILLARVKEKLAEQVHFLFHDRGVSSTVVLLAITFALIGTAGALAPGFAEQGLGIDARDLSFVGILPGGLGLLLGAALLARFNRGLEGREKFLLRLGVLSAGVLLAVLALMPGVREYLHAHVVAPVVVFERLPSYSFLVASLLFLLGAATALVTTPAATRIQEMAPQGLLGRMLGSVSVLSSVLTALGVLTLGIAADFFGPTPFVFGIGILAVVWALMVK